MKMTGLPKFMWLTTKQVVEKSWADLNSGKAISVPGWQYKLLSFVARYAPRSIVRKVGMNVRRKQRS
jgi:short-subunit dehydrogenase